MIWLIVIGAVVVVLALVLVALYNRLVRLRNRAENSWAQVDVQLRRRYDLIPNLVETVKGYASHERATFEEVTKARTAAQQARTVPEQAEAERCYSPSPSRRSLEADRLGSPNRPKGHGAGRPLQISICMPSSTTWSGGIWK